MKLFSVIVALLLIASCSSCAWRQYPHAAPTMMDVAVVKIAAIDHEGEEQGFCTAWKIGSDRMVTAGHCCTYEYVPEDTDDLSILLGTAKTEERKVPYFTMSGAHAIAGETATVLRTDKEHDICVLKGKMAGAPIGIAPHDPPIGERVWTAGYPHTTFLVSEGLWSGREDDQAVASVPVWGGASGSPILDVNGRAVGVLVAYYRPFDALSFIAPLEWLRINVNLAK